VPFRGAAVRKVLVVHAGGLAVLGDVKALETLPEPGCLHGGHARGQALGTEVVRDVQRNVGGVELRLLTEHTGKDDPPPRLELLRIDDALERLDVRGLSMGLAGDPVELALGGGRNDRAAVVEMGIERVGDLGTGTR
jgi:hypothetical protein